MVGKPQNGRRKALTPTQRQRRWRAKQKGAVKRTRRNEREHAMAERTITASQALVRTAPLYGVIYADPPWRFEPRSRITGMDRAADNHYPTMPLEEIKALPIPAAPDCVLFLCATAPMLPQALEVMAAWGFTYRTHMVWVKDRTGTGYWVRSRHELLLIGTRGEAPAPAPGDQPVSVVFASVTRHSSKPAEFAAMIERMFPNVPRIELFARVRRPGWDVWGDEAC
jgi:N6-adenosine-specific RNA methylase IME4